MSTVRNGAGMETAKSRPAPLSQLEKLLTQTDIPLFKGLSKRHLRRIARAAELLQHVGTVEVVHAGAPGDSFYVIVDGAAEYRALDGDTGTLQPGDYFGELALIDGAPRAATVTSIGELTALRISRSSFLKLLRDEPAIAVGLLPGLVAIVRELQSQLSDPA
jgi:CRP-like cAMP-binding protein